jgi:hypothetical protein
MKSLASAGSKTPDVQHLVRRYKIKTNSVTFSPQVNYTDWATATCWRNLVPTFADRGMSRGQRGGSPTAVNLSFLDRSRYFSFKYPLIYPHRGWVDPVPDPLLLRKSGSAGDQTLYLWVCRVRRYNIWDIWEQCSLQRSSAIESLHRCFEGTCRVHLQGQTMEDRNQHKSSTFDATG